MHARIREVGLRPHFRLELTDHPLFAEISQRHHFRTSEGNNDGTFKPQ